MSASSARPGVSANNVSSWLLSTTSAVISPQLQRERTETAALYGSFASMGVMLNALPIILTFATKMRKNNVHIMIATLSMADFLFSVSFLFGQTQYVLYREHLSPIPCRWLATFTFTTAFFEFIFPPILSLNRYVALYHANKYNQIYTRCNVILIILGSWAFCSVIPVAFAAFGKTKFDDDNEHCCIVVKDSEVYWGVIYWLLIIIPLICFCDGTMMFCNYKIYRKLTDHSSVQTLKNNVIRQNRELLYFLLADMTFPIMFHTTYHVAKFALPNRTELLPKRVFTTLYLINSCVRGLITLTMLRPYRVALKDAFCRCICLIRDTDKAPVYGAQVAPMTGNSSRQDLFYADKVAPSNCRDDQEETCQKEP